MRGETYTKQNKKPNPFSAANAQNPPWYLKISTIYGDEKALVGAK